MFWIVSGPSSVGKSTFIQSGQFFHHTGCSEQDAEVVFAYELSKKINIIKSASQHVLFHYNIARSRVFQFETHGSLSLSDSYEIKDTEWNLVPSLGLKMKAIILVTGKSELLRRVNVRESVEPFFHANPKKYKTALWNNIYANTDLFELYNAWCNELEAKNIAYVLLDSTTPDYKVIESRGMLEYVVR